MPPGVLLLSLPGDSSRCPYPPLISRSLFWPLPPPSLFPGHSCGEQPIFFSRSLFPQTTRSPPLSTSRNIRRLYQVDRLTVLFGGYVFLPKPSGGSVNPLRLLAPLEVFIWWVATWSLFPGKHSPHLHLENGFPSEGGRGKHTPTFLRPETYCQNFEIPCTSGPLPQGKIFFPRYSFLGAWSPSFFFF